ncbi:MAG: biotin/lipoyl-binding protein [Lachnospiraceae bacterium]|jgi:multidrug efflux pump subunit AcrA (membrane-fusion protein)
MEKDEEKLFARKRMEKWIKIFLIFLAFVWLCTIISKSIYVSGLPLVKTDTATKKYVEHIVETDGIVTAGGEVAVNTQAGLRVDKIYVRQGDAVKAGDILFTIDTADIAELISAKETELSKIQCNLSDFQVNAVIDAQKKEVAILWAKEDYETADKETALTKNRAKAVLEKAEEALEKHLADPVPYTADNARRNAWEVYHDWINKGYRIADEITAKEREIQRLEEQLAALENRADTTEEIGESESPKVLSGAVGSLADTIEKSENSTTHVEIDKKIENEENSKTEDIGSENIETENPKTENTEIENPKLEDEETEKTETENPKTENTDAKDTEEPLSSQESKENQNLVDEEKRTELLNKIKKANKQLLTLRDQLTKHDRDAVTQPDYSAEEAAYDTWQNTKLTLEEAVQRAKENYNDASYAREVTLRQKMREIAAAEVTSRADSTAEVYELEINQARTQIERLHAIKKQKGEIKAENDGIVSRIQIEVGSRTTDTAALLLTDEQRPCQFKFHITKEEGKYIHLMDTVAVKLNGQSSEMDITVDYFTENAQDGYDIVCLLPENVGQPGLSGSVKKTVQGEYHDLTLPVEAVYGENGAYYIYTLNEKEGILGSEYYVEKIKVQVKDKNDRYAAIELGTISADTKVITYSTKELKQGQSVRPQEQ